MLKSPVQIPRKEKVLFVLQSENVFEKCDAISNPNPNPNF